MTHSRAQTLILLKGKKKNYPVTFETTQTLQNNEEQMKGLLERVRLLGRGSPALDSLPF